MNTDEKNRFNELVSDLLTETDKRIRTKLWRELLELTNQQFIVFLSKDFSTLTIHQCEDIVQEIYLKFNDKILEKRAKNETVYLDKNGDKVKDTFSYLYRMARHEALSVIREVNKMQPLDENQDANLSTETQNYVSELEYKLEYRSKCLAISAIDPESQREAFYVIVQFELSGQKYTNDDVAKLIGASSANAVTQRKKEAKKKYIQLLNNYDKRLEQTEKFTLERIQKKIKKKLAQNSILDSVFKTKNRDELELVIWQIILLTKEENFENYCKFFLLDSISETSNKEIKLDFSELNYIFNHWIENKITYEMLINPKLNHHEN
ncbi:MAG: hypothetical protein COZ18_10950 [Flexibacter sp. CG_4_10_14_3_um_filter_32_15]|nr:MAG: hypothetical protein COZ18_10950 [Flexibacter sp. CG_4_10_14_3_um_filter_32_15]